MFHYNVPNSRLITTVQQPTHYNVPNSRLLFPNLSRVNPVYVVPSYIPRRPIYALVFQVVIFIQLSQPKPFVHVFSPPHVPKSRKKIATKF